MKARPFDAAEEAELRAFVKRWTGKPGDIAGAHTLNRLLATLDAARKGTK